jgi:hypothetical protein
MKILVFLTREAELPAGGFLNWYSKEKENTRYGASLKEGETVNITAIISILRIGKLSKDLVCLSQNIRLFNKLGE